MVAYGASTYMFWSLTVHSVAFWALKMFIPICYQKLIYFQTFWWKSIKTHWYKMHYALPFAKERFAAVSEPTEDKKVRREWGMFPLLNVNLLKPFSPHPSTRWRRNHIHCKMKTCSTVQFCVQSKLILNFSQLLPVTMQCFQFSGFFKKCKHGSYVSFDLARRLHFSFPP